MFAFCFLPFFLVRFLRSSGKRRRNTVLPTGERLLGRRRWKLNSNEKTELETGVGRHSSVRYIRARTRNITSSHTGSFILGRGRWRHDGKKIAAREGNWVALR